MTKTITCTKLKKEAEALDYQPYPGKIGERIMNEISAEAWKMWMDHQTMLINEMRLTPVDPKARTFLEEEMDAQIKHLNQTLAYTVSHESEKNNLLSVLIETTGKLSGGDNKALIFAENFKDKSWLVIPEGATNFLPFELLVFQYESDSY